MPGYARLVIGGTLGGGEEVWSCGLNYADPAQVGVFPDGTAQAWATAIAANTALIFPTKMLSCLGGSTFITSIKTYTHEAVGAPASQAGVSTVNVQGTGTGIHDLQTAVVCSLRTADNTRRGRGRFYWPAVGEAVQANGRVGNTAVTQLADKFRIMLNEIANVWPTNGEGQLVVVSATGGTFTPVNRIQVGDVLDNQRRRRDALVESYVSYNYPPAP